MEYFDNILCVSGAELLDGIITKSTYNNLAQRGQAKVVRRGCYGQTALIELDSLPKRIKEAVTAKFGSPQEQAVTQPFKDKITPDAAAITFYSYYILADGRRLPEAKQKEYATNASILNTLHEILTNAKEARKALGGIIKKPWAKILIAVNAVREEHKHTLPSNERALQRTFQKYITKDAGVNYEALISAKFCNDNSRKVTDDIENLIMSIYTMPNKPFGTDVHIIYSEFLAGKIEIVDQKSGEIFKPETFVRNGKAIEIGVTTVWNYLNQPKNRAIVDKVRSGLHRYNTTHRPHHHRHAPEFSFSKITMDDRDLPRKCTNGKWVKAYYAYDVTSGCVIGRSYSLNKDEALFLDCMQDTFRLIERENLSMPLQVEVEHHLVNKFFDDLEVMFMHVRFCNPGNSQEKHAEQLNKAKKYSVEKKTQNGIGRWWSKHEAYTVDRDKINDEFVEKLFTYERLVADDIQACNDFNNMLHPKQKKYPGKTRWQVLIENINPSAPSVNKAIVYKGIGEHTQTTIRRNQYVRVQHADYQIANVGVLDKLLPNNYTVDAYYLPDGVGMIGEVYLYQNGVFVCKATKIVTYNTANAEWTADDKAAYIEQSKYVSAFDSETKRGKQELSTPVIVQSKTLQEAIQTPVKIAAPVEKIQDSIDDNSTEDWTKKALDNL